MTCITGTLARTLGRRFGRTFAMAALVVLPVSGAGAQAASVQAPTAPTPLKVGDVAPDFTVTTATAKGVDAKPFRLSEHRGETVVLAFFPKARTAGCTVQMHTYRDKFEELFGAGGKVTLVAVSTDSDSALVSWAKDDGMAFQFAADVDRKVGVAYGASAGTGFHRRTLYVIDPTGKVSYVAAPFRQMAQDAYSELGKAVSAAGSAR